MTHCVDCKKAGIKPGRKLTNSKGKRYPGPRCGEHHRDKKREQSDAARARRWETVYGITADEYWAIYEHQGGVCAICRRATGTYKRLAVDHDHATGEVRGLCCRSCNRDVLGHARDDIEFFERAISYLLHPPARSVIGRRVVPQ